MFRLACAIALCGMAAWGAALIVPHALLRDGGGSLALGGTLSVAALGVTRRRRGVLGRGAVVLPLLCVLAVLVLQKAIGVSTDDAARILATEDLTRIKRWQETERTTSGRYASALPDTLLVSRPEARDVQFVGAPDRFRVRVAFFGGPVGCTLHDALEASAADTGAGRIACDPPRPFLHGGIISATFIGVGALPLVVGLRANTVRERAS